MAGDVARQVRQLNAGAVEHVARRRDGHRHQCRLRIFRQSQRFDVAIEHQRRQAFAQGVVDLLKHRACHRRGLGKHLAHADGLTALPWKYKSPFHIDRIRQRFPQVIVAGVLNGRQ